MNETQTLKGAVVKTLAIVGFIVTIGFFVYLTIAGAQHAPRGFASLASIVESLHPSRPVTELNIATEKIVVNSAESFQMSWTDMRAQGEYTFSYACVDGVSLSVRSADESSVTMDCKEKLTLSNDAHGLFVTLTSDEMRFTDVLVTVAFKSNDASINAEHTTKITVVNATIPVRSASSDTKDTASTPATTPTIKPTTKPTEQAHEAVVSTPVVETGTPDLKVSGLGSGVLVNGVFTNTTLLEGNLENAIRFDVTNVGKKTSGAWSFKTIFPSGEAYTSPVQAPLAPQAHTVFTLSFHLDGYDGDRVTFVTTLYPVGADEVASNNVTSQSVLVAE